MDKFINLAGLSAIKSWIIEKLAGKANLTDLPSIATDAVAGLVKTNPIENIGINDDGQLTVGGRLGQTTDLGLYSPVSAEPTKVGRFSLLLSEAKKLSAAHREFIVAGGTNVTLKTTAQAGATQYRVSNTQDNRFVCACFKAGRLAVNEAGARDKTVAIVSVKFANGSDVTPYFGASENSNDIIITVSETLNPDGTLSAVRGYGTWAGSDVVSVGQGNAAGGGKALQVGQSCLSENNNQVLQVGNRSYTSANNTAMLGSDLLNKKQYTLLGGRGHDTTSGKNGVAAFGLFSDINANTALAVGNGTAYNSRSNIFEVTDDNGQTGIVLKAPNGTKYKLSVDNDGNITTSQI